MNHKPKPTSPSTPDDPLYHRLMQCPERPHEASPFVLWFHRPGLPRLQGYQSWIWRHKNSLVCVGKEVKGMLGSQFNPNKARSSSQRAFWLWIGWRWAEKRFWGQLSSWILGVKVDLGTGMIEALNQALGMESGIFNNPKPKKWMRSWSNTLKVKKSWGPKGSKDIKKAREEEDEDDGDQD